MENIILVVVGITAVTIIGLSIRRTVQNLRQDRPAKCNFCSHCSTFCSETELPKSYSTISYQVKSHER